MVEQFRIFITKTAVLTGNAQLNFTFHRELQLGITKNTK
jgi:hypothetical protein